MRGAASLGVAVPGSFAGKVKQARRRVGARVGVSGLGRVMNTTEVGVG